MDWWILPVVLVCLAFAWVGPVVWLVQRDREFWRDRP